MSLTRINGWKIYGALTRPMTGRSAEQYIKEKYEETPDAAGMLVRSAWNYGISARSSSQGYFAVHVRSREPARFLIEEGSLASIILEHGPGNTESNRPHRPVPVAARPAVRYDKPIAPLRLKNVRPLKEKVMATRTATSKSKAKSAPVEEPEEVDDDLELEDEELEDEDDEELEDEDDELDDEEEDEEEEDEDEDEEEDDDDEDDEDDDTPDYTPYASKPITPVMQDFAAWMDFAIFEPTGTSIAEVGADDPVRLVAIAGTARMEFQRSAFNKERRSERQAEAAAAKAAKAAAPKAKPAAKASAKPVA